MSALQTFETRTRLPYPAAQVFSWFKRPGALQRMTPPWLSVKILEQRGGIADGARVTLALGLGPLSLAWSLEHRDYQEGLQFKDVQIKGPFESWEHLHRIEPEGDSACELVDRITYRLPAGELGRVLAGSYTQHELTRLFRYRHSTQIADLDAQARFADGPKTILVTGSSGLVGSALVPFLLSAGHKVIRLLRKPAAANDALATEALYWLPEQSVCDIPQDTRIDAVVHLAGESVADLRPFVGWSEDKKVRIRRSRVEATQLLCNTLSTLEHKPSVLISASAIGYYGERGAEVLDESAAAGAGFLAEVAQAWEAACAPARAAGIRVLHPRIGMVLSPGGVALKAMLPAFMLAAGGRLSDGKQWVSWIELNDLVRSLYHCLHSQSLDGAVNAVAPEPVSNQEFTRVLASVLRRPAWLPVPQSVLEKVFPEMAQQLLLASIRVRPERLLSSGFTFAHPQLEGALRYCLGRQ